MESPDAFATGVQQADNKMRAAKNAHAVRRMPEVNKNPGPCQLQISNLDFHFSCGAFIIDEL